jgi:hypothetical protein
LRRLLTFLLEWSGILCVPGGLLWALSPTGISISNLAFHTPNVFWKMFWSAPLLILLGLIGLQLRQSERSGLWERLGFFVAALGLVLIIAGDIGLYWLGIDDRFIVTAPAYNAFRIGLLVLAVGSILFAVTAPRDGALPTWGLLPFVLGSMCGLISFSQDFGSFGAVLWALYGVGWAWLGLSLVVGGFSSFLKTRRTTRDGIAVKH